MRTREREFSLREPPQPWSAAAIFTIALLVGAALFLRAKGLSAEGLADDEVHKWLAANRYLHGQFSGDDAEHPMLMKWLIALCIAICPRGWTPETLTRLPNVIAGAASVWLTAQAGRRLFGTTAGLVGCALAAVSPMLIGYQRVAKEDTLFGVFLLLLVWTMAEAAARQSRRWEVGAALSLAGLLATKYYAFVVALPPLIYLSLRDAGARWRVGFPRWAQLTAIAFAAWLCVNWTPLMPETWAYLRDHLSGRHVSTPSLLFMGSLYSNVPTDLVDGMPPWFLPVFAVAKLAPATLLLALAGIGLSLRRRAPGERVALTWTAFWFGIWTLIGGKYGRYFLPVAPALLLFAGHAVGEALAGARAWLSVRADALAGPLAKALAPMFAACLVAPAALSAATVGVEAAASLSFAPHYRLYVSPLAGGAASLDWLFPHCDYFDAGFREAVEEVAARAEPGAELASEIDLPARFYAARSGRPDLRISVLRDRACRSGVPCYVIVQPGRIYRDNVDILSELQRRPPWHIEEILGHAAATVYRLDAHESLATNWRGHSTNDAPSSKVPRGALGAKCITVTRCSPASFATTSSPGG